MPGNDYHIRFDGRLGGELEPDLTEMLDHRDSLDEKIRNALKEITMLKGSGFIVVDPQDTRLPTDEFTELEEAQLAGSNLAYQSKSGYAIVYAPVAILRPKRDTAIATPSKLLTQLSLANNQIAAAGAVTSASPAAQKE